MRPTSGSLAGSGRRIGTAGGGRRKLERADVEPAVGGLDLDLLALDDALEQLARKDPRKAELVKLRFFGGLTVPQAARALGIAPSTADEDWAYARSWLRLAMDGGPDVPPGGKEPRPVG